jgi:plastocyanin
MKKPFLSLSILLLFVTLSYGKTWIVTFSGFTFSPSSVTITFGDTVDFQLSSIHSALEVSKDTYDADGNTALSGGFHVPFGGGKLIGATVGTHYYVCENHYFMGMKGIIIVDPAAGIKNLKSENSFNFKVYPFPAYSGLHLDYYVSMLSNIDISILDLTGKTIRKVFTGEQTAGEYKMEIDRRNLNGLYLLRFADNNNSIVRKILVL